MGNSSFSYWAVWMASQVVKTNVVAPKDWFGRAGPASWNDIYEEGWNQM